MTSSPEHRNADDDVWCPWCGCLLYVFITGDYRADWCEARVAEYSGRDWRRAIEEALGLDDDRHEHTPDAIADDLAQRLRGGSP